MTNDTKRHLTTAFKTITSGEALIEYLVKECEALGIPPDDNALIQRLRTVNFIPTFPRAEFNEATKHE
jgi:hypothetical protein